MTAVNAGRVELDIVALAKDQVTATLREVNKSLGETKRQIDGVTDAQKREAEVDRMFFARKQQRLEQFAAERREMVQAERASRSLGGQFNNLAESADKFEKVQRKANDILGVLGFAGAIGGAVVGIVKLIGSLSSYSEKLADVERTQERFNQLLAEIKEGNFEGRIAQMTAEQAELTRRQRAHNEAVDKNVELQAEIEKRRQAILEVERKIASLDDYISRGGAGPGERLAREEFETELLRLRNEQADATREQAEQARQLVEQAQRLTPELRDQARFMRDILSGGSRGAASIAADDAGYGSFFARRLRRFRPGDPDRERAGGGGGPKSDAEDMARRMAESQDAALIRLEQLRIENGAGGANALLGGLAGAATKREAEVLDDLAQKEQQQRAHAKAVADTVAEYERWASAIDQLERPLDMLAEGLGGVASSLSDAAMLLAEYTAGNMKAGDAAATAVGGISQAAAAMLKGTREQYVLEGLGYVLKGGIHVLTPGFQALGAVEIANGIALAALGGSGAIGGSRGGGSGGSSGSLRPSRLDTAGGGGGTVVYNIHVAPGTDPQSVARELARVQQSGRGTGRIQRRGV